MGAMSPFGPEPKSRDVCYSVANGGKAHLTRTSCFRLREPCLQVRDAQSHYDGDENPDVKNASPDVRLGSTLLRPEPRTQRSVVLDDITLHQFLGALRRLFQKASLHGGTHSGAMVPLVPAEGAAVGVTKRYPGLLG
jgi:hypothetical protein